MSRTSIQINSLTKTFPAPGGPSADQITTAVDSVSLNIDAGELFFLLGPSGCGKTTLLRMIAGFIEPTRGKISFIEGSPAAPRSPSALAEGVAESSRPGVVRDVTFMPPNKRNTGMVFQSYALWPHMTIADNVAFGLDVRKVPAVEKSRRVMEALAIVHMQEYAQRKPNQLSGGQQQRVALARALVIRPSVLLLDEPLSNLDAKLRIELRSEIRRVCKETGITTVYVTHDQKEALSMADRVAIMRAGKVEQIGTPEDLYRRPGSRFVAEFLGETNIWAASVTSVGGVGGVGAQFVELSTAAGPLRASAPPRETPLQPGDQVQVSMRPESIAPVLTTPTAGTPNTLKARILETTYLGDLAQHTIELAGGVRAKMAILNPAAVRTAFETVRIAPEDVVLIPAEKR
jgi:iron(III) transport system ATP-binding protein